MATKELEVKGLEVIASGQRNSNRFAFGLGPDRGIELRRNGTLGSMPSSRELQNQALGACKGVVVEGWLKPKVQGDVRIPM